MGWIATHCIYDYGFNWCFAKSGRRTILITGRMSLYIYEPILFVHMIKDGLWAFQEHFLARILEPMFASTSKISLCPWLIVFATRALSWK